MILTALRCILTRLLVRRKSANYLPLFRFTVSDGLKARSNRTGVTAAAVSALTKNRQTEKEDGSWKTEEASTMRFNQRKTRAFSRKEH